MKKDTCIEEKVLRALDNTVINRYEDIVNDELENRREYYDDIKLQKEDLRKDMHNYIVKVQKSGIDDGSLKVEERYAVATNEEGKKKIKLINEAYDELNEELENVESCYYIDEDIDCDLNSQSRGDYVEIVDVIINFTDITEAELKQEFMNALIEETLELDSREKQITIKVGELFITSILEKNLNNYDNRIDNILSELM